MDPLSILLQIAFYAVFAATVWRFLRTRAWIDLALVLVFGSTAAIFAWSFLNELLPGQLDALRPIAIATLLAQPVLILWLVRLVRPVSRWLLLLAALGFAVATAAALVPQERFVLGLIFVGLYFVAGEGAAAVLLMTESQRRFGLHRFRLALAGIATALFGAAIFIAAISSAAAGTAGSDPAALDVTRGLGLLAAFGYLAAFVPPRWLRRVGQRAVAFDLTRLLVTSPTGAESGLLWSSFTGAARDILGARNVSIIDARDAIVATTETTPAVDDSPATPRHRKRRGPTVSIPLVAPGTPEHRLVAELEGQPLFIEDDVAVLALLGSMTARAIEREKDVVRLAEARRRLQESDAIRAGEARFRALLQAIPNAVLAVDQGGTVTWATGLTADLFGRSAVQLTGLGIHELVAIESLEPSSAADGSPRVRYGEGVARRADGSTFPADVALTVFDVDDTQFRLFVVSDGTWRQEANMMRDRFLGILSHELRTPITAIYGGTQLLLKPNGQLDDDSRAELLENVAAEGERLERIIENLLVLARVERGADFFEGRPVTIRPMLTRIINRERGLHPGLTINLTVAPGLALVSADDDYVGLIMRNLISNAAKYAGQAAVIDVVAEAHGDQIAILVRDNGSGLADADSDQLFTLYYRSPAAGSAPGAGIGLFVCRGLVTAMGGRIWARSRSEGGAEFGFSLPVHEEQGEETQVIPPQHAVEATVSAEVAEPRR